MQKIYAELILIARLFIILTTSNIILEHKFTGIEKFILIVSLLPP